MNLRHKSTKAFRRAWAIIALFCAVAVSYQNCGDADTIPGGDESASLGASGSSDGSADGAGGTGGTAGNSTDGTGGDMTPPSPTPSASASPGASPTPTATPTPVPTPTPPPAVQLRRYYNASTGDHMLQAASAAVPAGYAIDGQVYKLYAEDGANRKLLYQCTRVGGYHLITVDPGCEAAQTGNGFTNPVSLGGYVAMNGQPDGSRALYREAKSAAQYYIQLPSLDANEGPNAGYTGLVAQVGWVPK